MEGNHNTAVLSALLSAVSVSVFQVGNSCTFALFSSYFIGLLSRGYPQSVFHETEDPPLRVTE